MALLLASTCLTLLRNVLSDTDTSGSGRWQDSTLLSFIDRANKRVVGETLFPDSRVSLQTIAGVQLYTFPPMLKVHAVYVAGQLVVPSDLPTLEGRQVNTWDMSADGSTTAGAGGDAAPGTVGVGAPAWAVEAPLSYPDTNGQWVTPAPDAEPWDTSQRPRYYWRGGSLGLVPPPSGVVTLSVDCVRLPDTVLTASQSMTTPDNYVDAIVWAACAIAKFADAGQQSDQAMGIAEQNYTREKKKLIAWRGEFPGEQRNGPKPSVYRGAAGAYRKRTSRSGCR
jgi:hypothetical protein